MEIHISNELDDENGKEREWKSSKGHGESERVCTRERERACGFLMQRQACPQVCLELNM